MAAAAGGSAAGAAGAGDAMTSSGMYNWRVAAVNNALAARGKAEGPLTVEDLTSLGHLDQYHYLGVDACDHAIELLGLGPGARVLDIGSGIGGPSRYMAMKSGCDVTGVELQGDLCRASADLTQRVGLADRVRFVEGDFSAAYESGVKEICGEKFDHVISLLVILHFPKRAEALKICHERLNPGGTFLIEDFIMVGSGFTEKESSDLKNVVSASTVTSAAAYVAELEAAGFVDVEVSDMTPVWKAWTKARHESYRKSREETIRMHGEKVFNDRVAFYEVIDSLFAGGNLGGGRITGRKMGALEEKLRSGRIKVNGASSACTASLNEYGSTVAAAAAISEPPAKKAKAEADAGKAQPLLPAGLNTQAVQYHDSLQYHFFFPGFFIAGRVFHTKTLQQHSAWMYDVANNKVTELFPPSYEAMVQESGKQTLHLESSHLRITDSPEGGSFVLKARGLTVTFAQRTLLCWLPAGQNRDEVIHRPDLTCSVEIDGKTLKGTGYSKRYYGEYARHWGYRFIHGVTDEAEPTFFWNADATFGDNKYNYFKVLPPTGVVAAAESRDAWQQDCSGFGIINGIRHETRLKPLCTWETIIGGEGKNMESKMQNRYCEVELIAGGAVRKGVAYNERCYGTLG